MNKDLVNREFFIPGDILIHIERSLSNNHDGIEGGNRATELIQNKKVTYGQLKRLLHDMKMMDKEKESIRYNLYGGEPMEKWGWMTLNGERGQLLNKKKATQTSHNITGKLGLKNPFNKTHKKKDTFNIPLNPLKSNSDKTSVSKLITGSLFEEINRIKKLM
jgi:hypothetical protein